MKGAKGETAREADVREITTGAESQTAPGAKFQTTQA